MTKSNFKVKLTIGHKFYDNKAKNIYANGETLVDALGKLKKPEIIKTPGTLEVKKDDKVIVRYLPIPKMKALFNEKAFYREVLTKNLLLFLE